MKILLVDDDPNVLEYLETLLKELGHEVLLTDNAQDAIKKVIAYLPDLVLLDIVLPDKDGVVVLAEIKELDKNIAVVMITAHKNVEKVIESFRLGALDFLLKPFNAEYIKDILLPRIKLRKELSTISDFEYF